MSDKTKLRELTLEDVEIAIDTGVEWLPIRGNAVNTGNALEDHQIENELIERLNIGDKWAWCHVTVTAHWNGFEGEDHLGACSYDNEEGFRRGGYYDDMVQNAIDCLNRRVGRKYAKLSELVIADDNNQESEA